MAEKRHVTVPEGNVNAVVYRDYPGDPVSSIMQEGYMEITSSSKTTTQDHIGRFW